MISLNNLSLSYGARLLFCEVSLNLNKGCRYGIVGANGTGKSSLLRTIAGEEEPAEGEIHIAKNKRLGWLKQDQFRYENDRIIDVVLQGKPELWKALSAKNALLDVETWDEAAGYRLAELEEEIAKHNGYAAEAEAEHLLEGLGIAIEAQTQPLNTLSGGYKLRVLLAQTLFNNPDILLLDEPTNYLDIMTIGWLEKFLVQSFQGLLLFVSHDHDFLNNLSTHTLDIDYGEVRSYTGNYDSFVQQKQAVAEQKLSEKKHVERKMAKMQQFIDRFRATPSRTKQALSREKQMSKMEIPDIKKSSCVAPVFCFQQKRPTGKKVVHSKGICKAFGERLVLFDVDLTIERGEKVVVTGRNGIGKSTFLKILLGQLAADDGQYEWGHAIYLSYFAQDHHHALHEDKTLFNWLSDSVSGITDERVRTVLGSVLFTQDDVHKNILTLSGGEATRLLLAQMMLEKGNVLVLDEPTNHLDLYARRALAKALKNYEGTVIVVSHDRYFSAAMASRVILLDEEGAHEAKSALPTG